MYAIVNGQQMPGFIGRQIKVIGTASNAAARGTSFKLKTTDNEQVTITLNSPLTKPIEGYVEVLGTCSSRSSIKVDDFICFSNTEFDSDSHNHLCKLLHSSPDLLSVLP